MKFVKITQLNRRPMLMDAVVVMRYERQRYAQTQSVEAAYEAAAAQLTVDEREKVCDAPGKDVQ